MNDAAGHDLTDILVPTIWRKDDLLAVVKPAGIDVTAGPGEGAIGLVDLLNRAHGGSETYQPVNRLSRFESGILLLSCVPETVARIRKDLRSGIVKQEFEAVVLGRMGRAKMRITAGRKDDRPEKPRRVKGRRQLKDTRGRKTAERTNTPSGVETSIRSVKQGATRTLIRCNTSLPTTHALKAQLRGAGLRVLGDGVHDESITRSRAASTCLHLNKIAFKLLDRPAPVALHCKPPAGFSEFVEGGRDVIRMLHAALVRRMGCMNDARTDSFRLLTGDVENVPGLVVERFGAVVILQVRRRDAHLVKEMPRIARWYQQTLPVEGVYVKDLSKGAAAGRSGKQRFWDASHPIAGRSSPDQVQIRENGLTFITQPTESPATGLFLDHRTNRKWVLENASGKSVLNLFAYTCGFSVAAARGGAKRTTSVDLSAQHLDCGKENFKRNGIDLNDHLFFRSEATDYLKRAKRQENSFDMIIVDPPTFSHGLKRKQSFEIGKDLPALVAACAQVLAPGGVMLVSTNNRRMTGKRFKQLVMSGVRQRKCQNVSAPRLPVDFAADQDHAKTLIVRLA